MRIFLLAGFIALSFGSFAQHSFGTYYVAAKTGLSMRETPEAGAKVVDKIPYGTKVTTLDDGKEWKSISTEGLMGYWKKVKYNNKTGYIVDSYLFPWAPPKLAGATGMKQYLAQVSLPFGQKLVTRSGTMNQITEMGWELSKQLYKNGAEHHDFLAYEYGSDTYFLPDFSFQQGFLLLRLLPEFKDLFGEKDEFPTASKQITKGDRVYDIKLIKYNDSEDYGGPSEIQKIRIGYEDGASYLFEMYMQDNQLVIFFSGGV
ncbi:MAG: SH3 domain-containing protein [Bacteroidota bacterium]